MQEILAEIAMQGFVEIEKMGTYNIERIANERNPALKKLSAGLIIFC